MATLLIVEDDKQTNEAICEYLKSAGHKIVPAFDGVEALKIFEQGNIDLVILEMCIRDSLCISWNRTIISQTAKGHAKPRTSGTTPRIAERCNPYAQTADTSRIRQALIFPP